MKNISTGVLVIASIFLFSCSEQKESKSGVIDVASAMSNQAELKASDYFNKVQYIPLETTDECVIGTNPVVQLMGDKIVITTTQNQCYLFDKATGKFIRSIGHVGNDPEGYRTSSCVVDEYNDRLLFSGWNQDRQVYTSDGAYWGKINSPKKDEQVLSAGHLSVLPNNILVGAFAKLMSGSANQLVFFDTSGNLLSLLPNEKEEPAFNINELADVNVLNGEYSVNIFGPSGLNGVMIINTKNGDNKAVVLMNNYLWRSGAETYYKEPCNDTIYQVVDMGIIPRLTFDLGKYHWPYEKQFENNSDNRIYISQVLENKEIILFRFIMSLYDTDYAAGERTKPYDGIYVKATGETYVNHSNPGITDDLSNFIPFQPYATSSSGEFAGLVLAENVVAWFEENPDKVDALSEEARGLIKVDVEDNPVVVLLN